MLLPWTLFARRPSHVIKLSKDRTETLPIRHFKYKGPLWVQSHPYIRTPYDEIKVVAREFPDRPAFGSRSFLSQEGTPSVRGDFVFQTYGQVYHRVLCLAASLLKIGIQRGDKVGYYSNTREEFHIVHWACCMQGVVLVPIYDTLGPADAGYIMRHAALKLLFVSPEKLPAAEIILKSRTSQQKAGEEFEASPEMRVVVFDARQPDRRLRDQIENPGCVFFTTMSKLEEAGESEAGTVSENQGDPLDLGMIMYTSGTTGAPKGVMLSNIATLAGGATALYGKIPPKLLAEKDISYLSFLPVAHIFGIVIDTAAVRLGAKIGYYSGDVSQLTQDVAALKPSVFAGVPRVFQKIYDGINAELRKQSLITRMVFNIVFCLKYLMLYFGMTETPLLDKLVFNKIKEKFGGRLLVMISAGAPLPVYISKFLRICITDVLLEGYGLTETAGCVSSTDGDEGFIFGNDIGTIPYCTTEVKLVSVPSMNYFVTDKPPRGELYARGAICFNGYYKDPAKTAEVLDADGWVRTGDVCSLTPSGRIQVIDRTKNLFKLSQGEYVSSEEVEDILSRSPAIVNAFVFGRPELNYPVAVVVPQQGYLKEWACRNGLHQIADDMRALCRNDQVKKHILCEVAKACAPLAGFKRVKKVHVHDIPFDSMPDFLTPSLKLKRHVVTRYFHAELDALCDALSTKN